MTFDVNLDQFSEQLAALVAESLEKSGATIGSGDRSMKIQVVDMDYMFQGPCILSGRLSKGPRGAPQEEPMATGPVEPPRRGWVTPADLVRAMRALGGVIRDADRTNLIGEFIGSLSGPSAVRLYHELMADPKARAILEEGRDLEATLSDRAALTAMPAGSLGRAYFEGTATRDFDAAGLADAIRKRVPRELGGPFSTMAKRVVDMHDLWHVFEPADIERIRKESPVLRFLYHVLPA